MSQKIDRATQAERKVVGLKRKVRQLKAQVKDAERRVMYMHEDYRAERKQRITFQARMKHALGQSLTANEQDYFRLWEKEERERMGKVQMDLERLRWVFEPPTTA